MSKKATFLANIENKQCFINFLRKTMQENGIITKHATSDAIVIIAKTAIHLALIVQTVLFGQFGEYIDLLVLLLLFYEYSLSKLNDVICLLAT